jgi:hypothetical protein
MQQSFERAADLKFPALPIAEFWYLYIWDSESVFALEDRLLVSTSRNSVLVEAQIQDFGNWFYVSKVTISLR